MITNKKPSIVAVETAVVDLQYAENGGDATLKDEFFGHLQELIVEAGCVPMFDENPRKGDMRLVPAEDFDAALLLFARQKGIEVDAALSSQLQAMQVRDVVFGSAYPTAGGSLANTFHGLVTSRILGQPIINGHFITGVGECSSGGIFVDSLEGNIHYQRTGRQMECHVFPLDGDRILITAPANHNPAEAHIGSAIKSFENLHAQDRIIIGGFLFFTPSFHSVIEHVVETLEGLPRAQRPSLGITAAAQVVAASERYQQEVFRLASLTDTVIHGNAGEFRRLLNLDTDWRKPFEVDFAGLRGQALEEAKDTHTAYKKSKDAANDVAFARAYDLCQRAQSFDNQLRFVVTDGARSTYVISAEGIQRFYPQSISRSQIVNTVGAGDNFAAGFQMGDILGLPHSVSVQLGSALASRVIQQAAARLDENAIAHIAAGIRTGGALAHAPAELQPWVIHASGIQIPEWGVRPRP